MSLTAEDIALIKTSFARVMPKGSKVAKDFYDALFKAAPGVRTLFPERMGRQRDKLMSMLAYVVKHLDDSERLLAEVGPLARRHVGYGAVDAHYTLVGKVLIATLKEYGLSEPEEEAWTRAYIILSGAMIETANAPAPEALPHHLKSTGTS